MQITAQTNNAPLPRQVLHGVLVKSHAAHWAGAAMTVAYSHMVLFITMLSCLACWASQIMEGRPGAYMSPRQLVSSGVLYKIVASGRCTVLLTSANSIGGQCFGFQAWPFGRKRVWPVS